ncbi:MAG: DUF3782 domain-containing protein [Blastocatellales bacterium]
MTDQELRDLIAKIAQTQAETAEQMKVTDRKFAETAEQMKITDRKFAEMSKQVESTAQEVESTAKQVRQVNKQLGELGNKFGSFTEGMALPSMEKILYQQFKMDVVTPRAKARQNGHSLEIDVMAYDNGSRNEVYLVEVKSHLSREGIEQMMRTIEQFPKFFGAHSDRKIYGIIAAVDIPDNLRSEVLNKGLYLARIHDGTFELLTGRDFQPKVFGPAAKQNGDPKAKKKKTRSK